ncbi:MAG: sulfurtransferase TusA family protein [Candidatus Heimdallarchaeota archaeon]|nr:sulfurtransferase TusA family protein [Candidatus Heimdallarchaeota archaeon]
MSVEFAISVDARKMSCPLPILKMKKAIDGLDVGQSLELIATDPGSVADVNAWCRQTEHELLSDRKEGAEFFFYVKKTH